MAKKQELAVITPEEQAYMDSVKPKGGNYGLDVDKVTFIIKLQKDEATGEKIMPGQIKFGEHTLPSLKFRPIRTYNQVIAQIQDKSTKKWKMVGQSILFTDWTQEILDTNGGIACGRKFGKALKGMSPADAEANRKLATLYFNVFGFVEIEGVEVPAKMRLSGNKFKNFSDAINSVPDKTVYANWQFNLELEEFTKDDGSLDYNLVVTPDFSKKLPISPILDFDKQIVEWVTMENGNIIAKHVQANKYASRDVSNAAGIADEFDDSKLKDVTPSDIPNDLDDALPF